MLELKAIYCTNDKKEIKLMTCYIWHPSISLENPKQLILILTDQENNTVGKGSTQFIRKLLDDAGIDIDIEAWNITLSRSRYFTDFLGEDDWRDIWQPIWKIDIFSHNVIESLKEMDYFYIESNAYDESRLYPDDSILDNSMVNCLIISDFDKKYQLENLKNEILNSTITKKMCQRYNLELPKFDFLNISNMYYQIIIDIGKFSGIDFENGNDYINYILEICQELGGTIHYGDKEDLYL